MRARRLVLIAGAIGALAIGIAVPRHRVNEEPAPAASPAPVFEAKPPPKPEVTQHQPPDPLDWKTYIQVEPADPASPRDGTVGTDRRGHYLVAWTTGRGETRVRLYDGHRQQQWSAELWPDLHERGGADYRPLPQVAWYERYGWLVTFGGPSYARAQLLTSKGRLAWAPGGVRLGRVGGPVTIVRDSLHSALVIWGTRRGDEAQHVDLGKRSEWKFPALLGKPFEQRAGLGGVTVQYLGQLRPDRHVWTLLDRGYFGGDFTKSSPYAVDISPAGAVHGLSLVSFCAACPATAEEASCSEFCRHIR